MKKLIIGMIVVLALLAAVGVYARLWESSQPRVVFEQVAVTSIRLYSAENDLHWNLCGWRIRVEGESRLIDFAADDWDTAILEGDTVDMMVRKSFHWFGLKDELDGLDVSRTP
jgi:hypothetical protein